MFILNLFHQIVGWASNVNFGGVKFLYQILCLKVFILNIFHQILGRTSMGTSSYTSPYSWYTLGSNFEFYKLFRHVHGVFDKGMFFWHKLFLYIRIYMMFSCQLCWQPALLAIYKKRIYIYIYLHLDETSL